MKNKSLIIWGVCLCILLIVSAILVILPFDQTKNEKDKGVCEGQSVDDTQKAEDNADTDRLSSPEDYYNTADGYLIIGGDTDCQHNWNEWILTKASSIKKSGEEMRFCATCFGKQIREFATLKGEGETVVLDVDCILQMPKYPNGCEIVALTTVLKYYGFFVTTEELIEDHLPRGYFGPGGDDPFYNYLGDPYGLGVGCYSPCIRRTANSFLRSVGQRDLAVDVSGRDMEEYRSYIDKGIPVIFWGTTYMDCDSEVFGTVFIDDREIVWRSHSHCFVMIGYTDNTYIFCDPLRGIIEYPAEDVIKSHELVYRQACIINK